MDCLVDLAVDVNVGKGAAIVFAASKEYLETVKYLASKGAAIQYRENAAIQA